MPENTVTSWGRPARRGVRVLLALFLVLGAAIFVSAATPRTALASSCVTNSGNNQVQFSQGCYSIPITHSCQVIGYSSGGGTQAVECADIYVTWASDSADPEMWGVGEFYCQGVYAQCAGMNVISRVNVSPDLSVIEGGPGGGGTLSNRYLCNPSVGACPNGGRAQVSSGHISDYSELPEEPGVGACYTVTATEPAGNVIAIPYTAAIHSGGDVSSQADICF